MRLAKIFFAVTIIVTTWLVGVPSIVQAGNMGAVMEGVDRAERLSKMERYAKRCEKGEEIACGLFKAMMDDDRDRRAAERDKLTQQKLDKIRECQQFPDLCL